MAQKKIYDKEYKVQAVKLGREIGFSKAAEELGIPTDTIYGWNKAAKAGRLDLGPGQHTPQTARTLAEENERLRQENKALLRRTNDLRKKTNFWRKPALFSPRAVGSQQETKDAVHSHEDR